VTMMLCRSNIKSVLLSANPYKVKLRYFSNISISTKPEITWMRIPSGHRIPVPPKKINPINPNLVSFWGERALEIEFEGGNPIYDEANESLFMYKRFRPSLLVSNLGKWISINRTGSYVLGESEAIVREMSSSYFRGQHYHTVLDVKFSKMLTWMMIPLMKTKTNGRSPF